MRRNLVIGLVLHLFVSACGSRNTTPSSSPDPLQNNPNGFDPGTSVPFDPGSFGAETPNTPLDLDADGKGDVQAPPATLDVAPATKTPNPTLNGESRQSRSLPFQAIYPAMAAFDVPPSFHRFVLQGIERIRPLDFSRVAEPIQNFIRCYLRSYPASQLDEQTLIFAWAASQGVVLTQAEQSELAALMGYATSQPGRYKAALALLQKAASVKRFIEDAYYTLLGRSPTEKEMERETSIFRRGGGGGSLFYQLQNESVLIDITSETQEFMRRSLGGAAPMSVSFDERFGAYIDLFTRLFLGRSATPAEKSDVIARLKAQMTAGNVAAGTPARAWVSKTLLESEVFQRAFVELTTQRLLGRRDQQEVDNYTSAMQRKELDRLGLTVRVLAERPYYDLTARSLGFVQETGNSCDPTQSQD